jgi:hypothetical protein
MKLVIKTRKQENEKFYIVRVPNFYSIDRINEVIDDIKFDFPRGEEIVEHHTYGDTATPLEERRQLDLHGKVIQPLIPLPFHG